MCVCRDSGKLKILLKTRSVEVAHVRQREAYKFTTDAGYEIRFYTLKESVIRNPRMDEFTEIDENDNQEIEVLILWGL